MDELKPCPCCNGKAIYVHGGLFLKVEYRVECKDCGLRTMNYKSVYWADAKRMAMTAWNRRVNSDKR